MSPHLIARISAELESVVCIKLEAVPTPARIAALRQLWSTEELKPAGDCTILTGLGALYAGFDMEQGTEGFMTGFAFPEILRWMNDAAQAGDMERAQALYLKYLPLMVFEQHPGVAVRSCSAWYAWPCADTLIHIVLVLNRFARSSIACVA